MENKIQAINYCTGTIISFSFIEGKMQSISSFNFNTGNDNFYASVNPKDGQGLLTRDIFEKAVTVFCYDHNVDNYKEIFELLKNDVEYLDLLKTVMKREKTKMEECVKRMNECLAECI